MIPSSPPAPAADAVRPPGAAEGEISVHALRDLPEVRAGDDLAALVAPRLPVPRPGAGLVLVLASKIISKSEGRAVRLGAAPPSPEAERLARVTGKDPHLVEVILQESCALVRAAPGVLITRHRLGFVVANAGVDQSNLGAEADGRTVLLLPADPDGSAEAIRDALLQRFGITAGVVVADSFSRPWRRGVVNVALGAAGISALTDRRGAADRRGRLLQHTLVGRADLLASAAGLVMGEGAEGIPAAAILGPREAGPFTPAAHLLRPRSEDLFQ